MIERVDDEWVEEHVLESHSDPTLVYVSGDIDAARHVHVPLLQRVDETVPDMTVVEIDYTSEFAEKMQVCYVPTVLMFRRGELVQTMAGVLPEGLLIELAEKASKRDPIDDLVAEVQRQKEQQ